MFKKRWRIARWVSDKDLFIDDKTAYWFRWQAFAAANDLNITFSGLDGLGKILGGRQFFAIHEHRIDAVLEAKKLEVEKRRAGN